MNAPNQGGGATWHTPVIVVSLVFVIALALIWMVVAPDRDPAPQTAPIVVFDIDRVLLELATPGQFEDPMGGRAAVLAMVEQVAQEMADSSGVIILTNRAALGAPQRLDVTEQLMALVRERSGEVY